ncbi:disulfide bond formation protein B [Deinococcus sp. MIMF12]|uniref:Disulfide bond formation protein B n=1 Tax=Deinococcus rhizophilus TaxID=3049544 RepID=A0ABT7JPB3_9DEIO|nr:disulfide bond formation protein B [Deinococcus rhizophilus]MDL2345713.1 disulfide bond formation protein B [Deinococcus rhizophilus]
MTRDNRLYLAWVVSLVATLGSLYLSEIRGFAPCVLCWYQRIAMYPLSLLLGIAALRGDLGIRGYALPLAGIGGLTALIQNLEDWGVIPVLRVCSANNAVPCDVPWPVWGGPLAGLNSVLTIPVLSMIAFTLIIGLLAWRREKTL